MTTETKTLLDMARESIALHTSGECACRWVDGDDDEDGFPVEVSACQVPGTREAGALAMDYAVVRRAAAAEGCAL
jgi:hypothetical protein